MAKIKNIVVIYAENRSFDHLFGFFPGANGIANATAEQKTQLDHDGTPLPHLTIFANDGKPDPRFPRAAERAVPHRCAADQRARSTRSRRARSMPSITISEQINGGRNNMFAAMSNVGGWTMGYFDGSSCGSWQWAQEYTLADNFFMGAFGGSYLNHQWLICACAPRFPDAPEAMRARLDPDGKLTKKPDSPFGQRWRGAGAERRIGGQVTPDGYVVNTIQPPYQPSGIPPARGGNLELADPAGTQDAGLPLPPQTAKTIGDTLVGEGHLLGLVRGRLERRAAPTDGGRRAEKRKVIYTREEGAPDLPAAPPAVQLLRPLRARHAPTAPRI